ncbi:hypothetical protein QZM22_12825 [Burkholderia oklahomensis]|uniref:hypothetical protein n=1 Tax=Burkholderia oklahomensis TaxID=342113 RepID=UPI00264DA5E1|nr:hypothetical protein [Burkholderia oklahomensis]MDN7673382.1 hypothetical protein [Burkholderia oklahomensis]
MSAALRPMPAYLFLSAATRAADRRTVDRADCIVHSADESPSVARSAELPPRSVDARGHAPPDIRQIPRRTCPSSALT